MSPHLALIVSLLAGLACSAVIEVTAGAEPFEATYQFSDDNGEHIANFSATDEGQIKASGNLSADDFVTANGTSVEALSARLAALEAAPTPPPYPAYVGATLRSPTGYYPGTLTGQRVPWSTHELVSPHVDVAQLNNGVFKPSVAGYYSCTAALDKAMRYDELFRISLYKSGSHQRTNTIYTELQASGPTHNPARLYVTNTVTAIIYLDGSSDYVETYVGVALVVGGTNPATQLHSGSMAYPYNGQHGTHMTCYLVGV